MPTGLIEKTNKLIDELKNKNDVVLVRGNIDNLTLWDAYQDNKYNILFREKKAFECNACKNFISNLANLCVVDNNGNSTSIWELIDSDGLDEESSISINNIKNATINIEPSNFLIFTEAESKKGSKPNVDNYDKNIIWTHFYADFKGTRYSNENAGYILNNLLNKKEALDKIKEYGSAKIKEALNKFRDDSIYVPRRGEYLQLLEELYSVAKELEGKGEYYSFFKAYEEGNFFGFRSTPIKVLLEDGLDAYISIVTASTFRSKTNIAVTDSELQAFVKDATALGLNPEKLIDVKPASRYEIEPYFIWQNSEEEQSGLKSIIKKKENKVPKNGKPIALSTFITEVLPKAKKVEIATEHQNEATLLVNSVPSYKSDIFHMFLSGGSEEFYQIRKIAKEGYNAKIDADIVFTLAWNEDEGGQDNVDLDLHLLFNNSHVYFNNKRTKFFELDVDIVRPCNKKAIENIYSRTGDIVDGRGKLYVMVFSNQDHKPVNFKIAVKNRNERYVLEQSKTYTGSDKINVLDFAVVNGQVQIEKIYLPIISSSEGKEKQKGFDNVIGIMKSPIKGDTILFITDKYITNGAIGVGSREYFRKELQPHKKIIQQILDNSGVIPLSKENPALKAYGFSSSAPKKVVVKADNIPYLVEMNK